MHVSTHPHLPYESCWIVDVLRDVLLGRREGVEPLDEHLEPLQLPLRQVAPLALQVQTCAETRFD